MELIKRLPTKKNNNTYHYYGLFLCPYCKKEVERRYCNGLKAKSCGCMQLKLMSESKATHGLSNTKLFEVWHGMNQRCYNKNNHAYKNYGNRGITVCDIWKKHYIMFHVWASCHGYKEGLTIDRENNNGNYEPENCQWVTTKTNSRNRRNTKLNTFKVSLIRKLYSNCNINQKNIAWLFDVNSTTIYDVINERTWA